MSYKTDQWHNLFDTDISGEPNDRRTARNDAGYFLTGQGTNSNFIYPDRIVRNMGGADAPLGAAGKKYLKRGYIRNLALGDEDSSLSSAPLRCQFQFNPVTIMQSMSQPSGVLNFLQQDPAQLATPMMGQNSFSFELFFDRTMELNNGGNGGVGAPDAITDDLWAQLPPHTGGVLHDLSRLYSIIGVGLSQELIDYATNVYTRQAEAEASGRVQSGESTTALPSLEENSATLSDRLNLNVGNSALLMPLPVRIVFSSLYVIEGLVGGVTVRFSKFNSAMIPMQCAVTMTMQAMYVGFARRKTFFQSALQELANYERLESATNEEYNNVSAVPNEVKQELSKVGITLHKSGGSKGKKYTDASASLDEMCSHFTIRSTGNTYTSNENWDQDITLKLFFPKVISKGVTNSVTYSQLVNEELTVEVEWAHVKVYRYLKWERSNLTPDELYDYFNSSSVSVSTDKYTGAKSKNLFAQPYDEDNVGSSYKIPDVFLVREVVLNSSKVGGSTPGIVSLSSIDDAADFFGTTDGGKDSMVYSIEQKGRDDRLAVQGSDSELGMLVIDDVDYAGSAIEGTNNTTPVYFLVHFRAKIVITGKDGVREAEDGTAAFVIKTPQDFHTKQIKAEVALDWNMPPPSTGSSPASEYGKQLIEQVESKFTNIQIGLPGGP